MVRRSRATVFLGFFVILLLNRGVAQEKVSEQPDAPATSIGQPLQDLQRELETLRAAGKTKEADALQRQAQQMLRALLQQFRRSQELVKLQQDPSAHRLAEARRSVEQVQAEVGPKAAEPLFKRLAAIELSLKDAKSFNESQDEGQDEPEVHVLRIDGGVALPDEFTEGRDHRTVGYAEVELNYTARPVILVLYSGRPTLWNIKRNKCKLHAILRQDVNQELLGAGDCLVLENMAGSSLQQATGLATTTEQISNSYDGTPLTIGPSNRVWLGQYLLPKIASVATRAKALLTTHRLEPFKELRFTAAHYYAAERIGPPVSGISVGQFTIAGPIANSLVPVPERLKTPIVISGGKKPLRFALDAIGKLVMAEKEGQTFNSVPVAASLRTAGIFSSFCLDTKRDRLVLATRIPGTLCTYDIVKGKWGRLGDGKELIASIVYRAQDDVFFAITRPMRVPQPPAQATLGLIRMEADGKITSNHPLRFKEVADPQQRNVGMQFLGAPGLQLAIAGDKLALIYNGALARTSETPLKLLDAKTGDVIYAGPIRVNQGEDPALVVNREPPPPSQAAGWLARLDRLFAQADQMKAKLAEQKPEQAKAFAARLSELRGVTRGFPASRKQHQPYTVAVGNQLDDPVQVKFTDTSGPSSLYLVSMRRNKEGVPVRWQVSVGVGTELKEIVVIATQDELVNPPAGIVVRRGTQLVNSASQSTMQFNLTTINRKTNRLTIGPENGQWRAEMVKRQLDRLIDHAGIELNSAQLAELMEYRFFAVTRVGPVRRFPVGIQTKEQKPSLWAEFTIHGPIIGTEKPITLQPNDQVIATTKDRVYLFQHGRGFEVTFASINVAADKRTVHPAPPIRHSSRDCRSSFDASRNRLYVASREGINVFDLATMKWQSFAPRRMGFTGSLAAYNQADDMFYQSDDFSGRGRLAKRYNFRGALLDSVPFQLPMTARFGSQAIQSVGFGHYVGELQHLNEQGTISVRDLRNGELVYQGPLRRHVDREELSTRVLSSLYKGLANERNDADELIWQLTAAHNDAVRFLDKQLPVPVVAEVDIEPLVKQLDSDMFAERNAAFKELQELGSVIEPMIRRALQAKRPAETKARLERLIKTWESAGPQNSAERQHVYAVTVLQRIGSSPAIALLREINNGRGSPVARRAAREALQTLGK